MTKAKKKRATFEHIPTVNTVGLPRDRIEELDAKVFNLIQCWDRTSEMLCRMRDTLNRLEASVHAWRPNNDHNFVDSAIRTLNDLGYTYHGGEKWKPPLEPKPVWVQYGKRPEGIRCCCGKWPLRDEDYVMMDVGMRHTRASCVPI